MIFGIVVLAVGVLYLMQTMGLIAGSFWGFVWPIVIIAIGLAMIFGKSWGNCSCHHHEHEKEEKN